MRVGGAAATVALVVVALLGCAPSAGTPGGSVDGSAGTASDDPIAAALDLLELRYELVREGDYSGACALYTAGLQEQLAALADVEGEDCVTAHTTGAQNASDYLATAEGQGRAGLVPFFYVPSGIAIDASRILSDDPDVAIASAGAITSTDPREFEDGVGTTPGWLAGITYVVRGDDGVWRIATPGGD